MRVLARLKSCEATHGGHLADLIILLVSALANDLFDRQRFELNLATRDDESADSQIDTHWPPIGRFNVPTTHECSKMVSKRFHIALRRALILGAHKSHQPAVVDLLNERWLGREPTWVLVGSLVQVHCRLVGLFDQAHVGLVNDLLWV